MLYIFKVQSVVILSVNSEPLFQNSIMDDDYGDYDNIDIANQQDAERELNRRPRCIYNRVDPRQNFTDPVFKSHFR